MAQWFDMHEGSWENNVWKKLAGEWFSGDRSRVECKTFKGQHQANFWKEGSERWKRCRAAIDGLAIRVLTHSIGLQQVSVGLDFTGSNVGGLAVCKLLRSRLNCA